MVWDKDLVGPTRAIAASDQSPLRVLAGPGTGKTFALMRRVTRLLEAGATPNRILVCTFTRAAAGDLKKEVLALGVAGAERVQAKTLHSLCFGILSQADVPAIIGRAPRPLLDFEVRLLLEDLKAYGQGSVKGCKKKIEAFNADWARLQSENPGWPSNDSDRVCHDVLSNWLKFHRAMLIGELIPMTLHFLRENPASEFRHAFDHVLVDEYQDLNRAEQVLLDELKGAGKMAVIGDEDQSIYSFRYAHPEGIAEFAQTHEGTQDEGLTVCRRCPPNVVSMANSLIANNLARTPRELLPMEGRKNGEVYTVQWTTMNEEIKGIASFIHQRIKSGSVQPGRILILTQRHLIGYALRDELNKLGNTTHSFFQEQELDGNPKDLTKCQAQQAFTLLTLLADPEDRVALRCWCGFGNSTCLNSQAWQRLRAHCEQTGESPRAVFEKLVTKEVEIPRTQTLIARYNELVEQLSKLQNLRGQVLIDALFPDGEPWTDSFRQIASFALLTEEDEFDAAKLVKVLRERVVQPETPTNVDYVRVMSLHKSKGLTADLVVVAGCVEGLIPQMDYEASENEQKRQLEEQRRLFYVAITRTTKTLVLSSVTMMDKKLALQMGVKPRSYSGSEVYTVTSPFVRELGSSCPFPLVGSDFIEAAQASQDNSAQSGIAEDKVVLEAYVPVAKQPVS